MWKRVCALWELRLSQRSLWRLLSSGILRRVVRWKLTDALEEHVSFIFRVEGRRVNQATIQLESGWQAELFYTGFLLVLFFNPQDGGHMFFETSLDFQRSTRRYIAEGKIPLSVCVCVVVNTTVELCAYVAGVVAFCLDVAWWGGGRVCLLCSILIQWIT
jgi:hypothetical protein